MATNRPRGRVRNVTGAGKSVHRRGSGLGTGPVGKTGRTGGITGNTSFTGTSHGTSGRRTTRSSGGGLSRLIILLLVVLLGGGGGLTTLMGDSGQSYEPYEPPYQPQQNPNQSWQEQVPSFDLESLLAVYLVEETILNLDSQWDSFYMYKDTGGRLRLQPSSRYRRSSLPTSR